ncbi:hypothetical protein IFR05_003159 [Cadophora sp. M221]|nr:hypothetical protein IFR05_003159 [Cadophora sp. M221]
MMTKSRPTSRPEAVKQLNTTHVAARYLFVEPFVFSRDRQGMERLHMVMDNPSMAPGVTSLLFHTGMTSIHWMVERLTFNYMQGYNSGHAPLNSLMSQYSRILLDTVFEAAAAEYGQWNTNMKNSTQAYTDINWLKRIFERFVTLKEIVITRRSIKFEHRLLQESWVVGTQSVYFQRANNELIAMLQSLHQVPYRIKHFKHDQVPMLESLRRDGLVLCESDLAELLLRYSSTLKKLHIYNLGLWTGSLKGLLHTLRKNMTPDVFYIWGLLMGFHTDGEAWRIHPGRPIWEFESWSNHFQNFAFGKLIKNSLSSPHYFNPRLSGELEQFVRGKGTWSIATDDTQVHCVDRFLGHSSACTDCILDALELENEWNGNLDNTRGWKCVSPFGLDAPTHESDEELIEHFIGGYDAYGFNKQGNNRQGIHHTKEPHQWQEPIDHICWATAHREILGMIKDSIPRLSGFEIGQ